MAILSDVLIFYLPDVVEVLHPAVANIQHDYRIDFFRYGRFAQIDADELSFHRKENGKRSELRLKVEGVAKSNIELHWNSRPCQGGVELHVDTVVLVFYLDSGARDRFAVEENAVVFFNLADGANCFLDIMDG